MPEHTAVIYTLRRWRTRLIQGGSALSWSFGDTRPTTTTRKPRSPLPCTVYVHTDRSVCTVCGGGGGGGGGGKGLFPGTGCFCLLYHVALHTYVRVLEWQGEGRRRKHPLSLPSSSFRQGRRESEGRRKEQSPFAAVAPPFSLPFLRTGNRAGADACACSLARPPSCPSGKSSRRKRPPPPPKGKRKTETRPNGGRSVGRSVGPKLESSSYPGGRTDLLRRRPRRLQQWRTNREGVVQQRREGGRPLRREYCSRQWRPQRPAGERRGGGGGPSSVRQQRFERLLLFLLLQQQTSKNRKGGEEEI